MKSHTFQILQEHILNNLTKLVILCFQRSRIASCLLQGNPRMCERLPPLNWKTWELAELQLFPLHLIGFQECMTLLRAMPALNLGCILPAPSSWRLNSTVYVRPQPLGEFLPQYGGGDSDTASYWHASARDSCSPLHPPDQIFLTSRQESSADFLLWDTVTWTLHCL